MAEQGKTDHKWVGIVVVDDRGRVSLRDVQSLGQPEVRKLWHVLGELLAKWEEADGTRDQ